MAHDGDCLHTPPPLSLSSPNLLRHGRNAETLFLFPFSVFATCHLVRSLTITDETKEELWLAGWMDGATVTTCSAQVALNASANLLPLGAVGNNPLRREGRLSRKKTNFWMAGRRADGNSLHLVSAH